MRKPVDKTIPVELKKWTEVTGMTPYHNRRVVSGVRLKWNLVQPISLSVLTDNGYNYTRDDVVMLKRSGKLVHIMAKIFAKLITDAGYQTKARVDQYGDIVIDVLASH